MTKKLFPVTMVITIIAGIIFRLTVPDCGLSKIENIEDIKSGTIVLNYALGADKGDEDGMTEAGFAKNGDKYDVDSASVIAVVEPTGNLRQTEGSIGQEIIFKEIIKGNEFVLVQQKGYVYRYFGFRETDGGIQYMNTLNLMYPGNEYLIFLDASPLNSYMREPVFILKSSFFGYVNISGQNTRTLDNNFQDYDFLELKDYEFFSVSEKITNVLNNIRKELLSQYLKCYP
ncbi:MAG: hypothetical protein K2J60_11270 [Acetatifactor sp.]|nr:hypothetical protein [Acetatifactor sp.]